jgi:hypothetical protein
VELTYYCVYGQIAVDKRKGISMRAKNDFSCSLLPNYRYTLDNVREALRTFSEEFEHAASSGEPLRFDLTPYDESCLMTFGEEVLPTPLRLRYLFNDALDDIRMLYAVRHVVRIVDTPRFYCRVIRFDWFKAARLESEIVQGEESIP